MARPWAIFRTLGVFAVAWSGSCGAVDLLSLSIEGASGEGWSTGPIQLTLKAPSSAEMSLDLKADALRLPGPLHGIRSLSVICPVARREADRLRCASAQARVIAGDDTAFELDAGVQLDLAGGVSRLTLPRQPFAGGHLSMVLSTAPRELDVRLEAAGLGLAQLGSLLSLSSAEVPVTVTAGRLSGKLTLASQARSMRIDGNFRVADAAFSDDPGLRAGEDLDLTLQVGLERGDGVWGGDLSLSADDGALFLDPVLINASQNPLRVQLASLSLDDAGADVARVELEQRGVGRASGGFGLDLTGAPRLRWLSLQIPRSALAPLYSAVLQPFFASGPLSDLSVVGEASLRVDWRTDAPSALSLGLHGVDVGDGAGRFTMLGLDGTVEWRRSSSPGQPLAPTRLSLQSAQLGRLDIGQVSLNAALEGRDMRLLEELVVPVLDGRLRVSSLDAARLGTPQATVELESSLDPISMQSLSQRMAWLPLSGTLSGRVPALVFEHGRLRVEGDLELELFDGRSRISGLNVAYPFSAVPEIRTDITLENLSLSQLSRSLSFGSIEGRLSGRIEGLVMEGLRPVAFDAFLATPLDDSSRHRISQRAVNNLASLGGASAALSATFLRFFETFSYDRLGLGCRLRAGVCEMSGVEEASSGYYIVKGGGLPPRVNVVGFNRRVDWDTLLERLRAIASSDGPVIR